jgi:hypothetical protein
MKIPSKLKLILFFAVLFIAACTRNEANPESEKVETYESIEKGVSLEDARASLRGKFTEHKTGSQPDIDLIILEDGRQLVFVDNVLTNKNTPAEIDSVVNARNAQKQE